jgi:hypothetical protein
LAIDQIGASPALYLPPKSCSSRADPDKSENRRSAPIGQPVLQHLAEDKIVQLQVELSCVQKGLGWNRATTSVRVTVRPYRAASLGSAPDRCSGVNRKSVRFIDTWAWLNEQAEGLQNVAYRMAYGLGNGLAGAISPLFR